MKPREQAEQTIARLKKHIRIYQVLLVIFILTRPIAFDIVQKKIDSAKDNPYPLIDPARNLVAQEDFIVNIQPLRDYLNQFNNTLPQNSMSLYFEILNTGANIQINQNLGIFPASLAKLPLGMTVVKKVENGIWKWDNELVLLEQDINRDFGNLYRNPVGTRFTVEQLVKELLINSDNTAYKILLRNMEPSELSSIVVEIGLEDLFKESGKISAKEYTRLFRSLYTSSYLKREYSEKILDWLTQTSFNQYLGGGIPSDVKFAHKIGENKNYNSYSDAGIVYLGNRAYMLAVMVQAGTGDENKVSEIMKQISQEAYEYVKAQ